MAFPIVILLAVVVLALVVLYVVREQVRHRARVDEELHDERVPTLEYAVPTGQDPALILAALERDGYAATVDTQAAPQVVLIRCPAGLDRDRAHVRSVIASAQGTVQEGSPPVRTDVRFADEA
ncbi:MAG: hypothetical protein JF565_09975 [Propionibacteriales bacterium]|jgi:hypothetical protein|nr:hypothetical protein [Propionibacteriales bacterium]